MASEYTPTTGQIRRAWIQARWDHLKISQADSFREFNRWLSEVENQGYIQGRVEPTGPPANPKNGGIGKDRR